MKFVLFKNGITAKVCNFLCMLFLLLRLVHCKEIKRIIHSLSSIFHHVYLLSPVCLSRHIFKGFFNLLAAYLCQSHSTLIVPLTSKCLYLNF